MNNDQTMTALATTVHDPENRLYDQMRREWPNIAPLFSTTAVNASPTTSKQLLNFLRVEGAIIQIQADSNEESALCLGEARRDVVIESLSMGAQHTLHCDFDRVLHWSELHLSELRLIVLQIPTYDFTILGRTPRAFASHPKIQRDTEKIINHVFSLVSGKKWDITAAARGISRRAAEVIRDRCHERSFGVDAAWPLFIQQVARQQSDLTMAYIETEGLEFETVDRYRAEAAALGGTEAWIDQLDADPKQWSYRTRLAWIEIEAMQQYILKP